MVVDEGEGGDEGEGCSSSHVDDSERGKESSLAFSFPPIFTSPVQFSGEKEKAYLAKNAPSMAVRLRDCCRVTALVIALCFALAVGDDALAMITASFINMWCCHAFHAFHR